MSDIFDIDDFSEIINDVIKDILTSSHPLNDILHDYKEYMNNLIREFMELTFLKDDDKAGLIGMRGKIEELYLSENQE
jgi:methyltransferase-like protein